MRNIIFIGMKGCGPCRYLLDTAIEPLQKKYPKHVSVHIGWDKKVGEINKRQKIGNAPLIVVENKGHEGMRPHRLNQADFNPRSPCGERQRHCTEPSLWH